MKIYQCPSCGGTLIYDKTGCMKCDCCESEYRIGAAQPIYSQYSGVCPGCGNPVEVQNTMSCFCEACEKSIVNDEILAAMIKPNLIVPFILDTQEVEHIFDDWLKKRPLVPSQVKHELRIKANNRWLMPFWCFDYLSKGSMIFDAAKVRHYSSGNYNITETRHYDVKVRGIVKSDMIPADAMIELDDVLIDSVGPFNNQNMTPYYDEKLSGTQSKKYDFTAPQVKMRADSTARRCAESFMKNGVHGYSSVTLRDDLMSYNNTQTNLVYYPIYKLQYDYQGKAYDFYINGQTGKIAGDTPVSLIQIVLTIGKTYLIFVIYCVIAAILDIAANYTTVNITTIIAVFGLIAAILIMACKVNLKQLVNYKIMQRLRDNKDDEEAQNLITILSGGGVTELVKYKMTGTSELLTQQSADPANGETIMEEEERGADDADFDEY